MVWSGWAEPEPAMTSVSVARLSGSTPTAIDAADLHASGFAAVAARARHRHGIQPSPLSPQLLNASFTEPNEESNIAAPQSEQVDGSTTPPPASGSTP